MLKVNTNLSKFLFLWKLNCQVKSSASDTRLTSDPTPTAAEVNRKGYFLYQFELELFHLKISWNTSLTQSVFQLTSSNGQQPANLSNALKGKRDEEVWIIINFSRPHIQYCGDLKQSGDIAPTLMFELSGYFCCLRRPPDIQLCPKSCTGEIMFSILPQNPGDRSFIWNT